MAKRRTKTQKTLAKHDYHYSLGSDYAAGLKRKTASNKSPKPMLASSELYDYDVGLIRKDLARTLVVSSLIVFLEVLLYFYL